MQLEEVRFQGRNRTFLMQNNLYTILDALMHAFLWFIIATKQVKSLQNVLFRLQ